MLYSLFLSLCWRRATKEKWMQNRSRICHFSVSIRLSSHTNEIGHCGLRKRRSRSSRRLTISCNHRENFVKGSRFGSFTVILHSFGHSFVFGSHPSRTKDNDGARWTMLAARIQHRSTSSTQWAKLLYSRIIIIQWHIYYELHTKWKYLRFNMH